MKSKSDCGETDGPTESAETGDRRIDFAQLLDPQGVVVGHYLFMDSGACPRPQSWTRFRSPSLSSSRQSDTVDWVQFHFMG